MEKSSNNLVSLTVLIMLLVVCGCRSIRNVRVATINPVALTASETQKRRAEALAIYAEQPRTLMRVTRAAQDLEQVASALPDDYDAQWQAAQALAFLAENEARPESRREAAKRGIVLARRARELNPNRVECHYWYAINVGLLADVDRSYGLNAVKEMGPELNKAIEIDERYDYAGPLRVLGILYLRTPPPPASMGSPRKGLRILQRAVEAFPDYPENYLYLAEAFRAVGRVDEAKQALARVIDSNPWPDRQFETAQWKADASKLLRTLAAP